MFPFLYLNFNQNYICSVPEHTKINLKTRLRWFFFANRNIFSSLIFMKYTIFVVFLWQPINWFEKCIIIFWYFLIKKQQTRHWEKEYKSEKGAIDSNFLLRWIQITNGNVVGMPECTQRTKMFVLYSIQSLTELTWNLYHS